MDAATAGGGDELRSGASEGAEEGAGEPESKGKARGRHRASPWREGEAGGGRVRLRARHAPASPSGRRLKKQAALAGLGQPTGPPGGLARWAAATGKKPR